MNVVGVDIGGTKIAALIVDSAGRELSRLSGPTDPSRLINGVADLISDAVRLSKQPFSSIQAVGIGVPGMVDPERGEVSHAVNLDINRPLPLGAALAERFGVPIKLENDVRLAALGAFEYLQLPNLAYLNIGTGIAAGIVLDGQLYRGQNGMAGEIGYVHLNDQQEMLETSISGPALVRQAVAAGLSASHAGDVYALADCGNVAAAKIVDRAAYLTATAIQWLLLAYDVDAVVLGGGVTASGSSFLKPIFIHMARQRAASPLHALMLPESKITVLPSGFNAGLWGGIHLARQG
ncbi:MAG: ROK family protein [Chloroflexota bacterium]